MEDVDLDPAVEIYISWSCHISPVGTAANGSMQRHVRRATDADLDTMLNVSRKRRGYLESSM